MFFELFLIVIAFQVWPAQLSVGAHTAADDE